MAEVVYVPVTGEMTEERLRGLQAALDATGQEHGWDGVFIVMRCRPARSWCCGSGHVPATPAREGAP